MSSSQQTNQRPVHPTAEALYQYIVCYKQEHAGESPTRRELAAKMATSTSVISYHLAALEKAGKVLLSAERGKARMIGIPGSEWRLEPNGNQK